MARAASRPASPAGARLRGARCARSGKAPPGATGRGRSWRRWRTASGRPSAAAFDALRPRLARAVLVPSRVFDDAAASDGRGDTWRAVEFAPVGAPRGVPYHVAWVPGAPPAAPSAYRGQGAARAAERRAVRVVGGRGASGGPRAPVDLAASLEALFRGAEASSEATARAAVAEVFPRASSRLGPLLHVETLVLHHRDAQRATAVRLAVRLTPAGIRGLAPRYAAFLQTYATPIRMRLLVADPAGIAWWSLDASDNLWTLRVRLRDGSLVPLEGPADRRVPTILRATIDYSTRMGRFTVGASRLVAEVALTSTGIEKGFSARFLRSPTGSSRSSRSRFWADRFPSRSRGRARRRAGRPARRRKASRASSAATGPGCARPGSCAGSAE